MSSDQIKSLEEEIFQLVCQLNELRAAEAGTEVDNYTFQTLDGEASLHDLFAGRDKLLAIHNMGQACRYCTLHSLCPRTLV